MFSLQAFIYLFIYQEPTAIPQVGKKSARGWCVRRGNLLQDQLPVKFQDVKFKDSKFKHEIFVRII